MLKRLIPPVLEDAVESLLGRSTTFSGPHASWRQVLEHSGGYDSEEILRKVADAAHRMVAGEAPYERDGVLFDRMEHSFPLLAALLRTAWQNDGRITVIDFGGALGGSYRECRSFLEGLPVRKTWIVVEQPRFAAYGREHFQSDELKFCDSLSAALQLGQADVALLSSVLQYLPEPWRALDEIAALGCRDIVIDRTVVNMRAEDKLYVQHVPPSIYPADYPCWSLSEAMLTTRLRDRYDLVCDFPSLAFPALRRIDSQFKGYLFRKRSGT